MKLLYTFVIFIILAACFQPVWASKAAELKQACLENPTHVVCQERAAKQEQAKAKREAKADRVISRVRNNQP